MSTDGHLPRIPFLDLAALHAELHEALHGALDRTLSSGWLIGGPVLEGFEARFAATQRVAHCVGVANGLDALRLALVAGGIGPGDEVIVPSHTFIATWLAVSQVGAVPVPVEPDPLTFNIDPARLEDARTPRTRAIIPVHLYGRAAEMAPILEFAERHGLFVLEDAAQAFGGTWQGRPLGGVGHAAAWSFYPGKNLGALGDAGAVTTNDPGLAARVRELGSYGSREKYVHVEKGWNARLDPLQAAFLTAKLEHAGAWGLRRHEAAQRYLVALAGIRDLVLPSAPPGDVHGWHLFVVRTSDRRGLTDALDRAKIGWLIHYPVPPSRSQAYAGMPSAASTPIADRLANEVLSLPMGPHLSASDQERVVAAVKDWAAASVDRRPNG